MKKNQAANFMKV